MSAESAVWLPSVIPTPEVAMSNTEGFPSFISPDNGAELQLLGCSSTGAVDGAACVHVAGELDLSTAPEFERTIRQALARAPAVVVDLRDLTFMDSAGLNVIVDADVDARQAGRRLIVGRGARQVDRVFTVTGCCDVLEIVDLDPVDPPVHLLRRLADRGRPRPREQECP